MPRPITYDTSEDALLRPAKNAVFFDGWEEKDFTNENLLCAEMSRLAYAPFKVVKETLEKRKFTGVTFIGGEDPKARLSTGGTQGFVASSKERGLTVLAFRGTESDSPEDIITDLLALPKSFHNPERHIHRGFADRYEEVSKGVASALAQKEKTLLITGHSLGAALATLAAVGAKPTRLITFGSPRVGDSAFCKLLQGTEVRRFVGCCDVVTRVPPERFDKPSVSRLLAEVSDADHQHPKIRRLAGIAFALVAEAVAKAFSFGPTIQFAHPPDMLYIRANGTRAAGITDDEIARDQNSARAAYPTLITGKSGQVPRRDLADHAPINYLSAFTGRA